MTIFPTGTATFTNGSKSVTSVSLSSGTLAFFDKGTQVKVESDPVLDIVEATKAINADSFSLAEDWPHATGTYNFYATMTAEGIRAIAENIRTYIGRVQGETAALTKLYDTVQEGIDGTSSGDYFNVLVPSDPDIYSQLYLNDNGTAVLQVEMPTKAALEAATLAAQQSESNASDSEIAAAQSESNASDSEVAAEQALFDFTEIYWGEYASEPTQSPNGNPPSAGAFYFNTTSDTAFYYNGSGWVDPVASASVSPVADSLVKRDERGAVKAAESIDADNAVVLSEFDVAPTADKKVTRTSTGAVKAANGLNADEAIVAGQLPDDVANLYAKNNIVGTVSESGGVPTGAIIERGSNANGEYVKFADGTLVCYYWRFFNTNIAAGSFLDGDWTFPSVFFSSYIGFSTSIGATDGIAGVHEAARFLGVGAGLPSSTTTAKLSVYNSSSGQVNFAKVHLMAIGRWY